MVVTKYLGSMGRCEGESKGRPSDSLTERASDHLSPTSPLPLSLAHELVIYTGFAFSVVKHT